MVIAPGHLKWSFRGALSSAFSGCAERGRKVVKTIYEYDNVSSHCLVKRFRSNWFNIKIDVFKFFFRHLKDMPKFSSI